MVSLAASWCRRCLSKPQVVLHLPLTHKHSSTCVYLSLAPSLPSFVFSEQHFLLSFAYNQNRVSAVVISLVVIDFTIMFNENLAIVDHSIFFLFSFLSIRSNNDDNITILSAFIFISQSSIYLFFTLSFEPFDMISFPYHNYFCQFL